MKQSNIKVVIKEPRKFSRVETIKNELSVLQELVGGYIEVIREDGYDIIINEEGKLMDLEPNFALSGHDYVAGTAIFVGVDYSEGEFKSLPDHLIKIVMKVFGGGEKSGRTD